MSAIIIKYRCWAEGVGEAVAYGRSDIGEGQ